MGKLVIKEEGEIRGEERDSFFHAVAQVPHATFTQAPWYGALHKVQGREVRRVFVVDDNTLCGYAQIIYFDMPFSLKYSYTPYGPVFLSREDEVRELLEDYLAKKGIEDQLVFSRVEIPGDVKSKKLKKTSKALSKGSMIQPRNEWELNISPAEEELLSGVHKKSRYCIRQAEKAGIEVMVVDKETRALGKTLYEILKETAERNKFSLHNKQYYDTVLETIDREGVGYLVVGLYKDEIVTIHVVLLYGDTAMYAYGGSTNKRREIPSSHLVEWQSILHSKSLGMKYYNMGGVSTEEMPDPKLESVTRFKKRFGGYVKKHGVIYDIVHRPLWYYLYTIKKKLSS